MSGITKKMKKMTSWDLEPYFCFGIQVLFTHWIRVRGLNKCASTFIQSSKAETTIMEEFKVANELQKCNQEFHCVYWLW